MITETGFKKKSQIIVVGITAAGAGITVLLRDILFPPLLGSSPIHLVCLALSVTLLILFTFFLTKIRIRPTLIYGLVDCFVSEKEAS